MIMARDGKERQVRGDAGSPEMGKTALFLAVSVVNRFRAGPCVLGLFLYMAAILPARAEIPFKHVVVDEDGPTDMHCKAIGDINGDALPDLVVAGTKGTIVWYENPKWTRHVISRGQGGWSCDVKVGDINGDGHQDIVVSDWLGAKRIVG